VGIFSIRVSDENISVDTQRISWASDSKIVDGYSPNKTIAFV
jgi:hypothetical protein